MATPPSKRSSPRSASASKARTPSGSDSDSPGGTVPSKKKRRLGRGLGSLIPVPVEAPVEATPTGSGTAPLASPGLEVPGAEAPTRGMPGPNATPGAEAVLRLPVDSIIANTYQPRASFEAEALEQLAASIKRSGLMQPIVVRSTGNPGQWELVAGERRLRAVKSIGQAEVPALVVEATDQEAAELALIENVHREDLNPIERATGLLKLHEGFGLTHQQLAERVGLNRTSITNLLRILELDDFSRAAVQRGSLTLGHAKALLSISDPAIRRSTAAAAVNGGWSVRELERRVRTLLETEQQGPGELVSPITSKQANVEDLERRLTEALGLRVHIALGRKKGTGSIQIRFETLEEFDHLTERLGLPPQ